MPTKTPTTHRNPPPLTIATLTALAGTAVLAIAVVTITAVAAVTLLRDLLADDE